MNKDSKMYYNAFCVCATYEFGESPKVRSGKRIHVYPRYAVFYSMVISGFNSNDVSKLSGYSRGQVLHGYKTARNFIYNDESYKIKLMKVLFNSNIQKARSGNYDYSKKQLSYHQGMVEHYTKQLNPAVQHTDKFCIDALNDEICVNEKQLKPL